MSDDLQGRVDVQAGQAGLGSAVGEQPLELTVVMPCLNEAETLATCVDKALAALRDNGIDGEVVVADNGSTDGSQAIAAEHGARVVPVPIRGYGAALNAGITAARGRYVLMADADDSYNFAHIPRFLEQLRAGNDLVMGNRFQGGIGPGAMPPLHRYLGNPVLSWLGRWLFRTPIGDFHCGIRAFSRTGYDALDLRTTGMEFASEMVVKSSLLGQRIAEVPTTLQKDGRSRPPHLKTWRDGWRHLRFLLMYSPRWLFLAPGLLLMLVGGALTAWLLPAERPLGHVNLGVDTLAYAAAAILLGFQLVFFGVAAKVFATTEGLLPEDPSFERWFRYITLETGLIVGAILLLTGVGIAASSVLSWAHAGYGPLPPVEMMRRTLPAMLCMMLGTEICFASFFLSLLGLRRR
ncbi:glycosyltransferase family 2 protein [Terriglobus aquaticus]|uniref:Glycosyltransferase family 2 protein n=1 Tax=Terriglobus aquaticus TaxID=940139 RepID=A0ABW9KPK6_9BACT|nr:glycosyltransferase family 2 protein [Terriglobus aquaticus]